VVSIDYRDNAAHPHEGWFATGSVELAHSIGAPGETYLGFIPGSDIYSNLVKSQGTVTAYLPVGRATTLALQARAGRIVALDAASHTIIPKRFFMGGATTMRGYAEEEMVPQDVRPGLAEQGRHCASSLTGVGCTQRGIDIANGKTVASEGGEGFLLFKGELRVGLAKNFEAGLFADLGNLWRDPTTFRILDLRPNVGGGLRFVTPVGPAALDLGFNLAPDLAINERLWALHFTIGLF
jgi:outer membrane protein assembly factor BamA